MSNQVKNEISNSQQWTATRLRWRTGQWVNSIIRTHDVAQASWFFRQLPTPCRTTRKLFGYDLHLDLSRSSAQQLLYLMGERFIGERILFQRLVRPGMTVVDVGANIGYHTLLFETLVGDGGELL